jgi:hypothetical protein
MTQCFGITNEAGKVIGWVTTGPDKEKPIRKRNRWKWCFGCRKRLPHMLMMAYDSKPSYYDPIIRWKCGGCGKDRTQMVW